MGVPVSQMWTVASYVLSQRLRGRKRYPLVLMLEPLFRCNLACAGCGKIQYPPNAAQLLVDGTGRNPVRATGPPILRQRIVVNAIETQIADMRHDAIEGINIALQALFVLIVVEIFHHCLPERPCRSNAIDHRLANLVHAVHQVTLRFFEIIRAAAFCHSSISLDFLVDPPDAASFLQAR